MKYTHTLLTVLLCSVFTFTFCSKDPEKKILPDAITYHDSVVSEYEDSPAGINISVKLLEPAAKQLLIAYQTADSTALEGTDYVASSGMLIFEAGEQEKKVTVSLIHNAAKEEDTYFNLHISPAYSDNIKTGNIPVRIMNVDYASLVWSDEFDGAQLNTANWNYNTGNNSGWGNNEWETYTTSTDNVRTEEGSLIITAIKTGTSTYTSGRITTKAKQEFTYGKVEIRAQLPEGQGIWPALWMLGSNISSVSWPKCGEIDIMELLGQQAGKVYATVHYDNYGHQYTGSSYTLPSGKFSDNYHLFTLIWQPNHLTWYIDGTQYYTLARNNILGFPMDLPEFFIFNIAVGGNWPGYPDGTTVFPQTMKVDYIRVYQ